MCPNLCYAGGWQTKNLNKQINVHAPPIIMLGCQHHLTSPASGQEVTHVTLHTLKHLNVIKPKSSAAVYADLAC